VPHGSASAGTWALTGLAVGALAIFAALADALTRLTRTSHGPGLTGTGALSGLAMGTLAILAALADTIVALALTSHGSSFTGTGALTGLAVGALAIFAALAEALTTHARACWCLLSRLCLFGSRSLISCGMDRGPSQGTQKKHREK